ncbi:MAG: hypothetical protein GOMPHAMPRED_001049 [Gomphillus americanus]|uniref:U4/U6.U5 tri-snRNP-associated protein 2 n=1 Tax=Gomphillus americanus TaxID=1940652 RepID=A0A8H3F3X3_9LECA|nr:MAG: hypothetical protein GOMPHAMPRED_001049 [Gomphillus americanus]
MVKRAAEQSLEDVVMQDSPMHKKVRVESVSEDDEQSNVNSPTVEPVLSTNGEPNLNGKTWLSELSVSDLNIGEEEEEDSDFIAPEQQRVPADGFNDLYLDTIDRSVLDFDFEKLCSITLSNINVYACLVCGKYFQGRGVKSQAYFHALEVDHHVYISMETKKVYVLPESYEVTSQSLEDIKFVADPRLLREDVLKLDKTPKDAFDIAGEKYHPGFVGMNNIKANDYFNVIMQVLSHVTPIRNFFMLEDFSSKPEIVKRFSTLIRKIWNTRAFKAHVSPHELIQHISRQSQKRFDLLHQSDPVEFLSWFLNSLHVALGGSKTKPGTSIIQKVFQGQLKTESQQITAKADANDRLRFEDAGQVVTEKHHFLMLTLDLPPAPLFQNAVDKNAIPQVQLTNILSKYDGVRTAEQQNARKRYRLLHPLPPYLLLHIKRFSQNKFVSERNPTIVIFNSYGLDMSPYVEPNPKIHPPFEPIIYDLIANITHEAVRIRDDSVEGEAEKKVWKTQVKDKARDEWLEIQDLFVEKVPAETLFTRESYLLVLERRKDGKKKSKQ